MRGRCAVFCLLISFMLGLAASIAQEYGGAISADNLHLLRPYDRVDFASFDAEIEIGWFAANEDATEFVVLSQSGEVYGISFSVGARRWFKRRARGGQAFAFIDGAYVEGEPMILHQSGDQYRINEHRLRIGAVPVAIFPGIAEGDLFVEAIDDDGRTQFLHYWLDRETGELGLRDVIPFPDSPDEAPVMRIGRIDFPAVILSSLAEGRLDFHLYPVSFGDSGAREFELDKGPAVFGAMNLPAASHLAWSDPSRERLNRLDLATGENRIVAGLDGAYAQYLLLSVDASAILAVNLDFQPAVVAWNVESGERYELGAYRRCGRIPDKVELSRDGRALIIGCDTGLDIWRAIE